MTVRIGPPPVLRDPALNTWLQSLYTEMVRLDGENRKLQRDVEIARDNRLILADENGARYSVAVDSAGPTVEATALP